MGFFQRFRKPSHEEKNQPRTATITPPPQRDMPPEDPFQWVGERRHIKNAPYVLPSDLQEINRLDFQHFMLRYALQGNYLAPIQNPRMILDVGCGTGRWAIEMARQFPAAQVVGLDLVSQINHEQDLPPNLIFQQGNLLEGLPFTQDTFDFVHMRLLLFAIPLERWPGVIRELTRVTRPGGWFETIETGPQRHCGVAMDQIVNWITLASNKRGIDPMFGPQVAELLRTGGLGQVGARQIALPIGKTGGRLGMMVQTDVLGVITSVKQMVVSQGLATPAQYDMAVASAQADLEHHQGELPFYLAYGQRPFSR